MSSVLLVDAANVVGSRPTGWWRDRAGAAHTFVVGMRAAAAAGEVPTPAVVVLEGVARRGVEEGTADGVEVVHARGEGDDTMVALAAALTGAGKLVTLVSADRELGQRARQAGADVVGPGWLLDRIDPSA
jgi:hypothetical protein